MNYVDRCRLLKWQTLENTTLCKHHEVSTFVSATTIREGLGESRTETRHGLVLVNNILFVSFRLFFLLELQYERSGL